MTNNHVVENTNFLRKIRVQFNYQMDAEGLDAPTTSYRPKMDGIFHTNPDLDYTVFELKSQPINEPAGSTSSAPGMEWGHIPLNAHPSYHRDQNFNIIQHPLGRRKEVALQNNTIQKLFENVVRYTTDTEPGSSGSPVFDNLWNLMALHHAGGEQDSSGKWLNNQGIRINRIVESLRDAFADNHPVLEELGIE